MNECAQAKDNNEIFIIDKQLVNYFFKDENYETSELFFIYLTTHCKNKKAHIIPSLFEDITKTIKQKTLDKTNIQRTKVLAYLENWVESAEQIGDDEGDEKHDTILLYKILSYLNPEKKVVIISDNYKTNDGESAPINCLSPESLWEYLVSKKDFFAHLKDNYGFMDGATY